MSKAPSELAQAADFALGEMKAARAATFLMVWESEGTITVRTHPPSAALLRGLLMLLHEEVFPDEPREDDDAEE
jgi:hypothetical protein